MTTVLLLLKLAAILGAAMLIGNWYQSESKKVRAAGKPWYRIYATPPGILMLLAILLPVILWMIK